MRAVNFFLLNNDRPDAKLKRKDSFEEKVSDRVAAVAELELRIDLVRGGDLLDRRLNELGLLLVPKGDEANHKCGRGPLGEFKARVAGLINENKHHLLCRCSPAEFNHLSALTGHLAPHLTGDLVSGGNERGI